jgi:hypothetical protein
LTTFSTQKYALPRDARSAERDDDDDATRGGALTTFSTQKHGRARGIDFYSVFT